LDAVFFCDGTTYFKVACCDVAGNKTRAWGAAYEDVEALIEISMSSDLHHYLDNDIGNKIQYTRTAFLGYL